MPKNNNLNEKLNVFFYIKGSKDFPVGHSISQKFGFSTSKGLSDIQASEIAEFDTTIKDIYSIMPCIREINNNYSLKGDDENNIVINNDKSLVSRWDRSQEYSSTMLVSSWSGKYDENNNPLENPVYRNIYPNYTYTKITELLSNSENSKGIKLRECVFWQKMFTLFEFLKSQEENIINSTNNSESTSPNAYEINKNTWFDGNLSEFEKIYNKETAVGKYISLFIGNGEFRTNNEKQTNTANEDLSVIDYHSYNPYRMSFVDSRAINFERLEKNIKEEEALWGSQNGINITYVPGSARMIHANKENRISNITFKVKYQIDPNDKNENAFKQWDITLYFDPDDFVSIDDADAYKVWTYNDTDLDGKYKDIHTDGFNIYDNDYGNTISEDPNINGNFVISQTEFQNNIISQLIDISKQGNYAGYKEYPVKRITPHLELGDDDKNHIVWDDSENSKYVKTQIFYVFYRSKSHIPTQAQMMGVVREYLKDLHKDCRPTTEDPKTGVKYIGHGNSTADIEQFLGKMYPDLFKSVILHILPTNYKLTKSGEASIKSEDYISTSTPYSAYLTVRGYNDDTFNSTKFEYAKDGQPALTSGGELQTNLPIESFTIGGIDSDGSGKYNFPWYCVTMNTQVQHPLTSQTGFGDYSPKTFNAENKNSINSPADILQYILIKLCDNMFISADKARYSSILGVPMNYDDCIDISSDPDISHTNSYNKVKFIINNVQFVVHAQRLKNFGSITSSRADS